MPIAASVMGWRRWVGGDDPQWPRWQRCSVWPRPAVAVVVWRLSSAVRWCQTESSEREYLFAHQAMAPAAGCRVAHYVRTVSDTRVAAGER